jgi:hypothetical protein
MEITVGAIYLSHWKVHQAFCNGGGRGAGAPQRLPNMSCCRTLFFLPQCSLFPLMLRVLSCLIEGYIANTKKVM